MVTLPEALQTAFIYKSDQLIITWIKRRGTLTLTISLQNNKSTKALFTVHT